DIIGDSHDLAQLVRNQDDRLSLRLELGKDPEQMICFSRGQNARRLIEDENFSTTTKRLQYLDALLEPDRKLLDNRIRSNLQTVFALQSRQLGTSIGDRRIQQRFAFRPQDDV